MKICYGILGSIWGMHAWAQCCGSLEAVPTYHSLPSARSCLNAVCAPHLSGALEASLLVWQAREEGLALALHNRSKELAPSALVDVNGPLKNFDFSWAPAVKVNYEQGFSDSWDLDVRWTYFYSQSTQHDRASMTLATVGGFLPLWVVPQSFDAPKTNLFGSVRGIWRIHFNSADIELGYLPFLTPQISLRMHCGIKGISISQQLIVHYSDGMNNGTVTALPSDAALRNRCLGLGPRFGFNSEWRVGKGWFLFGDGAVALSLSVFDIKRGDNDLSQNNDTHREYSIFSKFHESFYAYRPNFEALAGFGWNGCFGKSHSYTFNWKAAYEVQYYWEQNMMRQMAAEPTSFSAFSMRGDLHFHGLTTTIRWGY